MDNAHLRWLLTGAASAGVIATGIEAAKVGYWVGKENRKPVLKDYIPPVLLGLVTIGCVLGVNGTADIVQNSLSTTILALEEARMKRHEVLNEVYIREEDQNKPATQVRRSVTYEDELFFDECLGVDDGYFSTTKEELTVAMYKLNREMQLEQTVTYEQFYRYLHLPIPHACLNKGWGIGAGVVYGYEWIDADIIQERLDDGLIVNRFRFWHPPKDDYLDYTPDEDL